MIGYVFALGLLLGFLVGIAFDDALDLYRSSRKEQPMSTTSSRGRTVLTAALVAAVVLQIGVGVLLIATRQSTARYTECTASWQQQFGEAYRARLAASVDVSTAMDQVVRAVASKDPDAFRAAVKNYVELRNEQDQQRTQHPLPPLPETLCGSPEEVRR